MEQQILRRLDEIEARIKRIELATVGNSGQTNTAPPPAPIRLEFQLPTPPPVLPIYEAEPPKPVDIRSPEDTEYLLGAKVLPWSGAVMVLLALIYFISWGFTKGFITKPVVFGIELAFAGTFMAFGYLKRGLKEQYGDLLMGIGSGGVFLTLAGGNLEYHLYEGATMVGFFMVWSLANMAMGLARKSQSMLWIGIAGGLSAGWMAFAKTSYETGACLYLGTVLPAAFIVAKCSWRRSSGALWAVAAAGFLPWLGERWASPTTVVAYEYAVLLGCLASYAWIWKQSDFDPKGAMLPILAIVTAGGGLIAMQVGGYIHLLILAAILFVLHRATKGRDAERPLLTAAVLVLFLAVPFGLPAQYLSLGLGVSAIVGISMSYISSLRKVDVVGLTALVIGSAAYLFAHNNELFSRTIEMWTLAALGLASASAMIIRRRSQPALYLGALLCGASAIRFGQVAMGSAAPISTFDAWLFGSAIYATGIGAFGLSRRSIGIASASASFFGLASIFYVDAIQNSHLHGDGGIAATMAIGIALVAAAGSIYRASNDEPTVASTASLIGAPLAWMLATFVAERFAQPADSMQTIFTATYSLGLLVAGFRKKVSALRYCGMGLLLALTLRVVGVELATAEPAVRVLACLGLGLCLLAAGYWYVRQSRESVANGHS